MGCRGASCVGMSGWDFIVVKIARCLTFVKKISRQSLDIWPTYADNTSTTLGQTPSATPLDEVPDEKGRCRSRRTPGHWRLELGIGRDRRHRRRGDSIRPDVPDRSDGLR